MRGSISTGRCARLSLGISETTTGDRVRWDKITGIDTNTHINIAYILQDNHPSWSGCIKPCNLSCWSLGAYPTLEDYQKRRFFPSAQMRDLGGGGVPGFTQHSCAVRLCYPASLDRPQMWPTFQRAPPNSNEHNRVWSVFEGYKCLDVWNWHSGKNQIGCTHIMY